MIWKVANIPFRIDGPDYLLEGGVYTNGSTWFWKFKDSTKWMARTGGDEWTGLSLDYVGALMATPTTGSAWTMYPMLFYSFNDQPVYSNNKKSGTSAHTFLTFNGTKWIYGGRASFWENTDLKEYYLSDLSNPLYPFDYYFGDWWYESDELLGTYVPRGQAKYDSDNIPPPFTITKYEPITGYYYSDNRLGEYVNSVGAKIRFGYRDLVDDHGGRYIENDPSGYDGIVSVPTNSYSLYRIGGAVYNGTYPTYWYQNTINYPVYSETNPLRQFSITCTSVWPMQGLTRGYLKTFTISPGTGWSVGQFGRVRTRFSTSEALLRVDSVNGSGGVLTASISTAGGGWLSTTLPTISNSWANQTFTRYWGLEGTDTKAYPLIVSADTDYYEEVKNIYHWDGRRYT